MAKHVRRRLQFEAGSGPAKGSPNDIVDPRSIMQVFFTNDHREVVRRERVTRMNSFRSPVSGRMG